MEQLTSVTINLSPREWNGQRVVSFSDIDEVHGKKNGTARKCFSRNRKHFVEGLDYIILTKNNQMGQNVTLGISSIPNRGITLLTESGYLMVVKSFDDDLSWTVQRELVNGYFRARSQQATAPAPTEAEPKPTRRESSYILPSARESWFSKVNKDMKRVMKAYSMTRTELYHEILLECGKRYNWKEAERQYRRENGFAPEYALDVVEYFPQLREVAEDYLNDMIDSPFM